MIRLIYLTLVFVYLGQAAWATQPNINELSITPVINMLQVLPNTCVRQTTDEACQILAHIKVRNAPEVKYCLTFAKHISKRCFAANTPTEIDLPFNLTSDIIIQIISEDGSKIFAQQTIKVAVFQPINRHRRGFSMGLL